MIFATDLINTSHLMLAQDRITIPKFKMKKPIALYRNQFGINHQIISNAEATPHSAAQRLDFYCSESTRTFMRSLRVPRHFWQNFLSHGQYGFHEDEIFNAVAQSIILRRINIYQFPNLTKRSIRNKKGGAFSFVKGPQPYPSDLVKMNFANEDEAASLINSLDITSTEAIHLTLEEQGVLPPGVSPKKTSLSEYKAIIISSLMSQQLLAYQSRDEFVPAKPTAEAEPIAASDKPVGLGPEPDYFEVSIKLSSSEEAFILPFHPFTVYDDKGEVVAKGETDENAEAVIAVPESKEYIVSPDNDTQYAVSGTVMTRDNMSPMSNKSIDVLTWDGESKQITTGGNGEITIDGVVEGELILSFKGLDVSIWVDSAITGGVFVFPVYPETEEGDSESENVHYSPEPELDEDDDLSDIDLDTY